MAYDFQSRIRYSEVGEDRRLTLPGVIDYFQDCSTFQSEELGVGLEALERRKRAWLVAYWHIVCRELPLLGEKVTVETIPYEIKGFYGYRNFRMKNDRGQDLAIANSMWIYVDTETGHPARVDEDIKLAYRMEEPIPMEKLSRKILIPEGCEVQESFQVMKSHLDTNHHVNNGQYILMAQEYLPGDAKVGQIRVEYRKSAVLHDVIVPSVKLQDGRLTVNLADVQGKAYAVVEFGLTD